MRSKVVMLFCVLNWSPFVLAQERGTQQLVDIVESLAENLPEQYDISELTSILEDLRRRPLDLNHAGPTELKKLFFLSSIQIRNLLDHVRTSGKLIDLLELQAIPGFDERVIAAMRPFVTLHSTVGARPGWLNKDHELLIRYGRNIKDSAGTAGHTGSPERLMFRYRLTGPGAISAGLVLEKDAGEPLLTAQEHLPDFVSGNISYRGNGLVRKIVLGDYSLQFGQGLTMWTSFSFGKSPDITTTARKETGLRPYYSVNEYAFLRGLAATLKLRPTVDLTIFGSRRMLDASSDRHSGQPLSVQESGFHRTGAEIANRRVLGQTVSGLAVQFMKNRLELTVTGHFMQYDKDFAPRKQLYDQFAAVERNRFVGGLAYGYTVKNASFTGEVAKDAGGVATVNGLLVSLSRQVSLGLNYRHYAMAFQNVFAQGIAEGTAASNERGLYGGIQLHLGKWNFSAYADWFTFPWLRYRVDAPSAGREYFSELSWQPDKKTRFSIRFKTEAKPQNQPDAYCTGQPVDVQRHQYRVEAQWQTGNIAMQGRLETGRYHKGSANEWGTLIYHDIRWNKPFARLSGNFRLAWFKTASYNSRLYAHENDVLYGSAFGVFSGRGIRSYLNLRYRLFTGADGYLRWGTIWRSPTDEDTTTGLIRLSDVKVQVRYEF